MAETTYRSYAMENINMDMTIISMVPFDGGMMVATKYQIYTLKDGVLEPAKLIVKRGEFE